MGFLIRVARSSDSEALAALNREAMGYEYPAEATRRQLEQLLASPFHAVRVAEQNGRVTVFSYGGDPKQYPKPDSEQDLLAKFIYAYYSSGVYEIADRIGLKYDAFKSRHEIFTAPCDLETIKGPVKKGTIYGHRFTMALTNHGEEVAALRYVHKVCHKQTPELPIDNTIHIEGLPSVVDATINGLIPDREGYVTSAAPVVNLIPSVVKGRLIGYVEACDLPVVIPVKQD